VNDRPVWISAFAVLSDSGLHTAAGSIPWQSGQGGPADVRRDQVYPRPLPSFGKLSLPDRLAFAAASLALGNVPENPPESTAICLALPLGSLSTDLRYCESVAAGAPSPAWFSATLPSSAVSEIAIQYKFKGPNRVYAAGDRLDWLWALDDGRRLVAADLSERAVVVWVDALEEQDRASPLVPEPLRRTTNRALAMVLTAAEPAGNAPLLVLEINGASAPGETIEDGEYFCPLSAALSAGAGATLHVATTTCRAAVLLHRK